VRVVTALLLGLGSHADVGVHQVALVRRLPARPGNAAVRRTGSPKLTRVGYLAFLFNFFGANRRILGLHSYAGIWFAACRVA
jgi:hypothetical protein